MTLYKTRFWFVLLVGGPHSALASKAEDTDGRVPVWLAKPEVRGQNVRFGSRKHQARKEPPPLFNEQRYVEDGPEPTLRDPERNSPLDDGESPPSRARTVAGNTGERKLSMLKGQSRGAGSGPDTADHSMLAEQGEGRRTQSAGARKVAIWWFTTGTNSGSRIWVYHTGSPVQASCTSSSVSILTPTGQTTSTATVFQSNQGWSGVVKCTLEHTGTAQPGNNYDLWVLDGAAGGSQNYVTLWVDENDLSHSYLSATGDCEHFHTSEEDNRVVYARALKFTGSWQQVLEVDTYNRRLDENLGNMDDSDDSEAVIIGSGANSIAQMDDLDDFSTNTVASLLEQRETQLEPETHDYWVLTQNKNFLQLVLVFLPQAGIDYIEFVLDRAILGNINYYTPPWWQVNIVQLTSSLLHFQFERFGNIVDPRQRPSLTLGIYYDASVQCQGRLRFTDWEDGTGDAMVDRVGIFVANAQSTYGKTYAGEMKSNWSSYHRETYGYKIDVTLPKRSIAYNFFNEIQLTSAPRPSYPERNDLCHV